jgi:AcrR family transcriptional regulator
MRAAIRCLHRFGYSATTTSLVAEQAGISRGGMLHQFRTKADLMLAVVEHVFRFQRALSYRLLKKLPPGADRFMALTEITWQVQSQTPSMAMLEILVAARSDRALGRRLAPLADTIDRETFELVWQVAVEAGIDDRQAIADMVHLHLAAMRGLSVGLMYGRTIEEMRPAVDLLKRYNALVTAQIAPPAA